MCYRGRAADVTGSGDLLFMRHIGRQAYLSALAAFSHGRHDNNKGIMVKLCAAYGCHNREGQEEGRSFYRFPADRDRRRKWLAAVRRVDPDSRKPWQPSNSDRLCSDHFVGGRHILGLGFSVKFKHKMINISCRRTYTLSLYLIALALVR